MKTRIYKCLDHIPHRISVYLLSAAATLLLTCGISGQEWEMTNGVVPKVNSFKGEEGFYQLQDQAKVVISSDELRGVAQFYVDQFSIVGGIASDNSNDGDVFIAIDSSIISEGYHLSVDKEGVNVTASDPAGAYYAMQTLAQIRTNKGFPYVQIEDSPRFAYRGMMLDVSRYFFTVKEVKRFIDIMAMHKLNKFHWHLTDDQGWRIEIKKYPLLTEIGSVRKETMKGHFRDSKDFRELYPEDQWDFRGSYIKDSKDYDGAPHGGYYTQEDIKEIIQYAADRYIDVIPEIDVPGHASALLAAYPEFGLKDSYEVSTRWSIHPNILKPSPETIQFLKDILSEVIELFPGEYIHVGGDEANKTHWEDSEYCQDLITKLELEDVKGLQSYFIGQLDEFITSQGRKLLGWNEILDGGLSPNATVMSWTGEQGGIEAAEHGHEAIMAPYSHVYFDYYQDSTEAALHEPLAQGGLLPLAMVYQYEPIPKELNSAAHQYIIGAQACVWTEYIPTMEYLEYMILPRAAAFSEVVWSKKEQKNLDDFMSRLNRLTQLYEDAGYNYAKHDLLD